MQALEIENLTKIYNNDVKALKGISLSVEEGDFFALLGPNGAGKSTTIGITSSLINKTSGLVKVFGHDIDTDLTKAKQYIGLEPQEFNFSQFEKVMAIIVNQAGYYGIKRKEALVRAEEVLKQLALWDKKDTPARELSGGMKRRLMIARALMHKPKLLILDEPTAGVDIEIRRSMWAYLQKINAEGTTIILTTHYLEEAEFLCRQIGIIDGGRIIEDARMSTVLRKLQNEVFILSLSATLTEAPTLAGFKTRLRSEDELEVEKGPERDINELFAKLDQQNIKVVSMRNKANRLEELFMRLVDNKSATEKTA